MRTAIYDSPEHEEFRRKMEETSGDVGCTIYGFCENNQNRLNDCLEEVDRLLKRHNLQIVIIDDGSTDHIFKVETNGKEERSCKYPKCHYYDSKSKVYCCSACAGDHHDYDRLHKGKERSNDE